MDTGDIHSRNTQQDDGDTRPKPITMYNDGTEMNIIAEDNKHTDEQQYYNRGNSGTLAVTFNLTKSLLGAGIFTFPNVYSKSGFFFGIASLIMCTLFVYWTANMLTKLGDEFKTLKYETIVKRTIGKWGSAAYSLSTFLLTFTGMISYSVIISDSIPPIIVFLSNSSNSKLFKDKDTLSNPAWKFVDRRVVILIVMILVLLPLCMVKNLKFLSFTSMFGLIYVVSICIISVVKTSMNDSRYPPNTQSKSELLSIVKLDGLSAAISSTAFANAVQHSQLPFFNSMKSRSLKSKKLVLTSSLLFSTFLIMAFSIPTYLNIGNNAKGNILTYFPDDDIVINITRLAFAMNIMFTFPLLNYVCRDVVFNAFHGGVDRVSRPIYLIYTFAIVVIAVALSAIFCDLGVVVNLSGGLSASIIAFILPQFCYARFKNKSGVPISKLILLLASTSLGFLTIILTIFDTVSGIAAGSSSVCKYKYF